MKINKILKKSIMSLSLLASLLFSNSLFAGENLSGKFLNILKEKKNLTSQEIKKLQSYDIYFIPGILAESLIGSDKDSSVDVSLITKDYFGEQLKFLNKKYKINAKRIKTSSHDVSITQRNIREAIYKSKLKNKKVILLSHSLGGLALIEELVNAPELHAQIGGIAFLQSPFYGTQASEIIFNGNPQIQKFLKPLLPLFNISQETIDYVGIESRKAFMKHNAQRVREIIKKIPSYTFSGINTGEASIFKPVIDLMEFGCIKGLNNKCITPILFNGPYDKSDGLVPLKSSHLENADYVHIEKVDHAEIILRVPFEDYSKEHMTTSWLRLLLQKMK